MLIKDLKKAIVKHIRLLHVVETFFEDDFFQDDREFGCISRSDELLPVSEEAYYAIKGNPFNLPLLFSIEFDTEDYEYSLDVITIVEHNGDTEPEIITYGFRYKK